MSGQRRDRFRPVAYSVPFDKDNQPDLKFQTESVQEAIEEAVNYPAKVIWVATNGNDATANGTASKPFLTIKAACESITDNSTNNRYNIKIAPGNYSEDNPINVPAYTMVEGTGKGVVKILPQNDDKLFIANQLSRFQNFLIMGNGTSNEVGIYFNVENGQVVMWDIALIDTYIGVHLDEPTAWILGYNLELLTAQQTIDKGIYITGGRMQVNNLTNVTQSSSAINNGVIVDGANSSLEVSSIKFNSTNFVNGLIAQNDGNIYGIDVNIRGATNGVTCLSESQILLRAFSIIGFTTGVNVNGANSRVYLNSGAITGGVYGINLDNSARISLSSITATSVIGLQMNNASIAEGMGVDLHECSTLNLNVIDSNSQVFLAGGDINKDKLLYQQVSDESQSAAYFINRKVGDEGLVVFSELAVGRPDQGFESIFGEGDSYTIGMNVLTSDGTDTSTTEGSLTDVSSAAAELDGNYFGFEGTTANHCIYISSDVQNQSFSDIYDYARLTGIKSSQITACVETTEKSIVFESWNGSAWVEGRIFCSNSSKFYAYGNDAFIRANISEQIRFGRDLLIENSVKKTINGKERYWIRLRIKNNVTIAPTFNQWKISNNRTEINSDGTITMHGTARYKVALSFQSNTFGETGGVTNANFDVGAYPGSDYPYDNWLHTMKNNQLNGNNDAIYANALLPEGVCTSCPLNIKVKYLVLNSGTSSDGELKVSSYMAKSQGVGVADRSGGHIPIERPLSQCPRIDTGSAQVRTVPIPLGTDYKILTASTQDFDISNHYEGDLLLLRIGLNNDGDSNKKIAIIGIDVEYVKWTLGTKI